MRTVLLTLFVAFLTTFAPSASANVFPSVQGFPRVSSPTDRTSLALDDRPGAVVDYDLHMYFAYGPSGSTGPTDAEYTDDVGSVHTEPPAGGFGGSALLDPANLPDKYECDLYALHGTHTLHGEDNPTGTEGDIDPTKEGVQKWPPPHHPPAGYYSGCPLSSKVGEITINARLDSPLLGAVGATAGLTGSAYIITSDRTDGALPEVPVYLGVSLKPIDPLPAGSAADVTIKYWVRTKTDYGLHFTNPVNRVPGIQIREINFRFFGHLDPADTPSDPTDDVALVNNPTRCTPWTTTMFASAYDSNTNATTYDFDGGEVGDNLGPDGTPDHVRADETPVFPRLDQGACDATNLPPFAPTITTSSSSSEAGAPTAFSIGIFNTYTRDPSVQYPAQMKKIVTTLPEGMNLNPAAAESYDELQVQDRNGDGDPDFCLPSEFNKSDPDVPSQCPRNALNENNTGTDIGDVLITSPLLSLPLQGDIFLGDPEPNADHRYKLFLEARGAIGVKLEGRAYADASGRIRSVFGDPAVDRYIPQAPVSAVQMDFKGGPRAPLTNPTSCGEKNTTVDFTPWTSPEQANAVVTDSFTVDTNCSPGFAPSLTTSLSTTQAGAHPDLTMTIDRPDGQQLIKDMLLREPAGLMGSADAVPLCPIANADSGTCGEESHVGNIVVDAGSGPDTIRTNGKLYLAASRADGEPVSLAVKIPAIVGPFNLGNVLVNSRVQFRQSDYGLDALTASIPAIFEGVPTRVRRMQITLFGIAPSTGKPFMTNASGCDEKAFTAEFTSYDGGTATAASPYQATGCDGQTFAPTFNAKLSTTSRNSYPASTFTVTNPDYTASQKSVSVSFPEAVKPNVLGFPPVCKNEQRDAGSCPANTKIGSVAITTPLLPIPLQGDVHLVPGTPLPGLTVFVRGMINFRLDAKVTQGSNLGIVTTFNNLPDAPLGKFVMNLQGGKDGGALKISECPAKNGNMEAVFTSHYGKQVKVATDPKVDSCDSAMKQAKVSAKIARGFALRLVVTQPGNAPNIRGASVTMPRGVQLKKPRSWKRLWKRYAKGTASGGACRGTKRLKGATQVVPSSKSKLSIKKMPCRAGKLVVTTKPGAIVVSRSTVKKLRAGVKKCSKLRGTKKKSCLKKRASLVFKVNVLQANGKKRNVSIRVSGVSAVR